MRKSICAALAIAIAVGIAPSVARGELFDFDSAPMHTSLPVDLTAGMITIHVSATGAGFSIQPANTMGFTPAGFAGLCIYPNSVFAADLVIDSSRPLGSFSILFSPQELGCDDSATLRARAYMDGAFIGTSTAVASPPGTWPSGTLIFSSALSFNHIVIHYDSRPPTCQDWGPIFMADNLTLSRSVTGTQDAGIDPISFEATAWPNPFELETSVRLSIPEPGPVSVTVHDVTGRLVRTLYRGPGLGSQRSLRWDGCDDSGSLVARGVYLCRARWGSRVTTARMVLLRVPD